MNKKIAIVTGLLGQDGTIFSSLLLNKGFKVYGTIRPSTSSNFWRLQEEGIIEHPNLEIVQCDITDSSVIFDLVNKIKPDWFVNLAALSAVGDSFNNPVIVSETDALGPIYCLESIRQLSRNTRFYQASSSEMIANSKNIDGVGDENTNMIPESPYAAAKLFAHNMVRIYRKAYNIFACSSILYNHTSSLRGEYFIERKICKYVAELKLGLNKDYLYLGNINASRDIGYAREYMDAVYKMLSHNTPDDYTICTGMTHTIKELLSIAFNYINKSWNDYVKIDSALCRPCEVHHLLGNNSKAKNILGWEPTINIDSIIKELIDADIKRLSRSEMTFKTNGYAQHDLLGIPGEIYRNKNDKVFTS